MLDKKALRKFADENLAPAIPPGHGLLRAEQVDHIIRTDVRNIAGHRTLTESSWRRFQSMQSVVSEYSPLLRLVLYTTL